MSGTADAREVSEASKEGDAVDGTAGLLTGFQTQTVEGICSVGFGADVCIDAVGCEAMGSPAQTIFGEKLMMQSGSAIALWWAINSVKKGGIVSIVGVYGPTGNPIPIGNVVNKGITIQERHLCIQ